MSEYKPSLDEFLKDISTHRVEILLGQGIYRHLRCRVEEPTWLHWFDIHTGPNFLLIRGDMGSVCFSRVEDMFTFFASDPSKINASYWAEKIEGLPHGGTCMARKFDGDRFKEKLVESLERYGLNEDLRRRVIASLDSEIEWCEDESFVRRQVDNFELDGFSFVDTFEVDGTVYLFHYIWLIRAICWAIGQYEQQKAVPAPSGPHWERVGQNEYQALYKNRTLSVSRNSWVVYVASLSSVAHGAEVNMEKAKAAARAWVDA